MWSHWNILRNSGLSETESCFAKMLLTRRPQLFTAMLDSDTDDSDRNDWDIVAQVILVVDSYISWTVDQWAINRNIMIISSTSIDCHALCYWTGTGAVFFTLMQVYWMICHWINVIYNHWVCIGVYLWQLRQLQIRTNCHNTCRRCQPVSITDYFLFYFVVHMHGYVLLTIGITIQPVCNNLEAGCYWKV